MSEDKYNAECSNRKAFSLQMNEEDTGGISYSEFVVWNRRVHLIITNVSKSTSFFTVWYNFTMKEYVIQFKQRKLSGHSQLY